MLKDSAPDSNRPRRIEYKVTKASSNPFHLFVRDVTRLHTCLSPFDDLLPFNEASTTSWTTPAKAWPSTFSEGPVHSLTSLYRISTATRLHDNVCKLREGTVRDHDLCREGMYLRPIITKNESLGKSHSMPAIHHAGSRRQGPHVSQRRANSRPDYPFLGLTNHPPATALGVRQPAPGLRVQPPFISILICWFDLLDLTSAIPGLLQTPRPDLSNLCSFVIINFECWACLMQFLLQMPALMIPDAMRGLLGLVSGCAVTNMIGTMAGRVSHLSLTSAPRSLRF